MEITDVFLKIKEHDEKNERLLAFCSITFDDCYVLRDLRVIQGDKGLFVAMPSRRVCDKCPECGGRNWVASTYCNDCGGELPPLPKGAEDKSIYADVFYPCCREARKKIHDAVVGEYRRIKAGGVARPIPVARVVEETPREFGYIPEK